MFRQVLYEVNFELIFLTQLEEPGKKDIIHCRLLLVALQKDLESMSDLFRDFGNEIQEI